MDENMTCNPTCHEMDKDSWSPKFCSDTTSKMLFGWIFIVIKASQQIWLVLLDHFLMLFIAVNAILLFQCSSNVEVLF
jgi:hypothetical protein